MRTTSSGPEGSRAPAHPVGAAASFQTNQSRAWTALGVVLVAQFCIIAAIGTVTIAIPAIREDLGATPGQLQWILMLFQLGFALLLITGGRLGDLYGTRRLFLLGFSGFVLGNLVAAAAPTAEVLLTARLAQGLCGGLAAPQVLAMIQTLFPGNGRARAIGAFAAISGSAYMLGQLITGVLLGADVLGLGWRAAFLVYVPIGVVGLVLAVRLLPRLRARPGERLDLSGVALVTCGGALLLYPLNQGQEAGWPPSFLGLLGAAIVVLYAFARHQRALTRRDPTRPLVNIRLLRLRSFRLGLVLLAALGTMTLAQLVYITIGLQTGFGLDPLATAVVTAPFPTLFMVGAAFAARLTHLLGRRIIALAALLILTSTLAFVALLTLGPQPVSLVQLLPLLGVLGFGYGITHAPLMTFALSQVPVGDEGASSGMLQTARQFGSALGVAVFGAVFFSLPGSAEVGRTDGSALPVTMLIVATGALLLLIIHSRLPRQLLLPEGPTA